MTAKVLVCYCQPVRVQRIGGTTPPQGPDSQSAARKDAMHTGRWTRPAKRENPSYTSDGAKNGVARLRGEGNLRVKRSDP